MEKKITALSLLIEIGMEIDRRMVNGEIIGSLQSLYEDALVLAGKELCNGMQEV